MSNESEADQICFLTVFHEEFPFLPSVKRGKGKQRKSEENSLCPMQKREKKISQEKRQNLSGEIKKNPFLFIRFALSLLLLLLHSSHCLPLTETGLQEKITASQLLIFPARYLFPSALSGTAHSLRRRKKLPHELILKSVKVQREMVLEEKQIRSVFLLPSTSKKKRKSPRLRGRKSQDRGEKISLRK